MSRTFRRRTSSWKLKSRLREILFCWKESFLKKKYSELSKEKIIQIEIVKFHKDTSSGQLNPSSKYCKFRNKAITAKNKNQLKQIIQKNNFNEMDFFEIPYTKDARVWYSWW